MSNTAILFGAGEHVTARRMRRGADARFVGEFVRDTFSGEVAGTDLNLHVGEVGAAWTRHLGAGWNNPTVVSSAARIYGELGGVSSVYYASGVPASADYEVDGIFHFFGGSNAELFLAARLSAAVQTCYLGGWKDTAPGPRWQVYRLVAGVLTLLTGFGEPAPAPGEDVPVVLSVDGDRVRLSRRNEVVIDVVDAAPILDANRIGYAQTNYVGGWLGPADDRGIHLANISARPL